MKKEHFPRISLVIIAIITTVLTSCSNSDNNNNNNTSNNSNNNITENTEVASVEVKTEPEQVEFGINLNEYHVFKSEVKRGETFGEILQSKNVPYSKILQIAKQSKEIFNIRKIRRGKNYTLLCNSDSIPTAEVMIYQPNNIDYIVFDLRDSINVYSAQKEVKVKERVVSGQITSSMSNALDKQNVDYRVSNKLSEIYAWTIDFFRLQKGDYFKIIYDEKYINDTTYVGIGNIKAVEFSNGGQSHYAFLYEGGIYPEYYDETGKNLRKAFLKAPLKFGTFRISSKYSGRRFHPVQKRWKAHLGTDYAAPTGTPIIATANGTVSKSAYTKSNGNYVKLRHNSTYSTQYLHMTKRAVKVGQKIKQGQVIGYVGMTGLATGPHVCYRFWKNGKQVDGMKQKLPEAKSIEKSSKNDFIKVMTPYKKRLDKLKVKPEDKKEEKDLLAIK
ncbi:MAG: peptidoglycan DD-metalloendopeptidase family protein [Ichthyobacteriaceae bacterium]|nr:peptidoglycan DD-metalloendopeptidase family protein [Ichthyobacteriaceae bacterium]